MSRALTTCALVLAIVFASGGARADAASEKALRAQIKELKFSRALWRDRARIAEFELRQAEREFSATVDAMEGDLEAQVRVAAVNGKISFIQRAIFEPLRTTWPCGATLYQGTSLWSLDLSLSDSDLVNGEFVKTDCSG